MQKAFFLEVNDQQVPCRVCVPDSGDIQRLVLGVHGLAGCSEDAIQSGIAEEMLLFDAATFRFDFPGHGKHPASVLTVRGCIDTLLAVATFARQQYPQVRDLCIFATGFGAYITLLALKALRQLPGQLRLVVQTPSVRMSETLLRMINFSKQTFWAMEKLTFPLPRPLDVTYGFYEELETHNAMADHELPILILQGETDDYIPMEDIRQFRRLNGQARLVVIPGVSHRFMEEGAWDMVLDLTRDWFAYEQVLLADWE